MYGPDAECNFFDQMVTDFKGVKFFYIYLSLGLFIFSNVIRAIRWNMLFVPMGYKVSFWNSFLSIMLGYFVNLGFPRAGEVARVAALSRNEKIPIEKVAGTLVIDRGMDVLCLGLIILLAIAMEYDLMWNFLVENAQINPYLFLLLLIPLAGFLWFLKIRKSSQSPFIQKINDLLIGFIQGITSVAKMKNKFIFILLSVAIWFCYYAMTYATFFSYEPTSHLSAESGLVVFSFGALGMVIPSPGGSGTYHYLIMKGLELYGIDTFKGFTLANLVFIPIQVLCNIGIGILALIFLPLLRKRSEKQAISKKE